MNNKNCRCPYVICKIHGNCMACIEKSRKDCEMVNCMEEIAESLGATFPIKIPKTIICDDYESMSRFNAEQIVQVVNEKSDVLICIPAEDTAIRTYEILKEMQDLNKVSFKQARFVALYDWVDSSHQVKSSRAFLDKYLYDPLTIQKEQVIAYETSEYDLEEICNRMNADIVHSGGIGFMLMSIGMKGEVGLNSPGESFDCYTKVVDYNRNEYLGLEVSLDDEKLTKNGITMGIRHMFEAKKVVLFAGEKEKADIISKVYRSRSTEQLPATVLKMLPGSIVVLGRDAASQISDVINV